MSWWDYGYQIAGFAKRTTIVDNNTWNNSHIALVSTSLFSMTSPHCLLAGSYFTTAYFKYVHTLTDTSPSRNPPRWRYCGLINDQTSNRKSWSVKCPIRVFKQSEKSSDCWYGSVCRDSSLADSGSVLEPSHSMLWPTSCGIMPAGGLWCSCTNCAQVQTKKIRIWMFILPPATTKKTTSTPLLR